MMARKRQLVQGCRATLAPRQSLLSTIQTLAVVSAFDPKRTSGSRFDGVLNAEITLGARNVLAMIRFSSAIRHC
jgi:hypothetical protein